MWYQNNYRRHLCDMHIDDWNEEFLSRFSPEEYLANLKRAKIQNAMLYFQSHAGHCFFPTETGKMHAAFRGREDMMKRLSHMCRESGIRVTGYYSVIYNTWAWLEHPEWRIVTGNIPPDMPDYGAPWNPDGSNINRYGVCCPNNPGYRDFVSAQLREIADYFEYDAMFFDMLFWPARCRCSYCQKRFREETGHDLPTSLDWSDPLTLLHIRKRREWMGQFAMSLTKEMKALTPGISVEHNVATSALPTGTVAGCGAEVVAACDYAGGDLYGDMYSQSFTCKYYKNITNNQPFEYMLSRCTPNLNMHTVTKSHNALLSAVALTTAHHGATLVIDAIDPVGTLDARVYERLGGVFEKTAPYEKYLVGDMIEDVGLYYSNESKFNAHGEPYTNHVGTVNLTRVLVENNISFGVTGSYHDFNGYRTLVASCLTEEDKGAYGRLADYVKNGGHLYISGGECAGLLRAFFGCEPDGRTEGTHAYIAPTDRADAQEAFGWFNKAYPLPFSTSVPTVRGCNEKDVLATVILPYTTRMEARFASIHSDPPGVATDVPAMLFTEYGKGKVLWSALPLECIKTEHYGEVFVSLLKKFFGLSQTVVSDAPYDVEVLAFKDGEGYSVSSVQLCERSKARKVEPFTVSLRTDKKPTRVVKLPEERACAFEYSDGWVKYTVETLTDMLDMRKIFIS